MPPQKAGTEQEGKREKSLWAKSELSVGATPLVWGLTEAPDQEAGPHKGGRAPAA